MDDIRKLKKQIYELEKEEKNVFSKENNKTTED